MRSASNLALIFLRLRVFAEAAGYFFADAIGSFRRNGLMTAAAVTTVMVALLTVGAAVLGGLNLNHLAATLDAQVAVVAFLRDGTKPAQVKQLQQAMTALPGVTAVRFVSKAEALARLRQRLGQSAAFEDLAANNPLPDSLEIRVASAQRITQVAAAVGQQPGVEDVTYGAQVTDRLIALTRGLRLVAVLLTCFLAAVALIVVVNTLRLTVMARAREIEIMQLVGATRWFVRWPFVIEGVLEGVVAACVAVLLLTLVYSLAAARLQASLPFFPLVPAGDAAVPVALSVVAGGMAVGAAGSLIAMRRFLAS